MLLLRLSSVLFIALSSHGGQGQSDGRDHVEQARDNASILSNPKRSESFQATACGNAHVVGVGHDGKLRCSENGSTWDDVSIPMDDFIRSVTFGRGLFVAVGGSYEKLTSVILNSNNGRHWVAARCPIKAVLHGVTFGAGRFITVGANGSVLGSLEGRQWHRQNSVTEVTLAAVAFGNGVFVAGGDDGMLINSLDGIHWVFQESGTRAYIGRITFQAGRFYAGSSVLQLTSRDGMAWEPTYVAVP
jgi:hypothetical protein